VSARYYIGPLTEAQLAHLRGAIRCWTDTTFDSAQDSAAAERAKEAVMGASSLAAKTRDSKKERK
jgi:hypothetical protein